MTSIDQHVSLRTRRSGQQECHAPVCNIRVIERRFKWFVLHQQALLGVESGMCGFKSFLKPSDSVTDVLAARIVGTVRKPGRDVTTVEGASDGYAVQNMIRGSLAD